MKHTLKYEEFNNRFPKYDILKIRIRDPRQREKIYFFTNTAIAFKFKR